MANAIHADKKYKIMSSQSIYIQNSNENVNNKLSNYVLKDKNNEDILIIFKQNSVILNLNEAKKQNEEISMANFIENINFIKSSKNIRIELCLFSLVYSV